MIKSCSALIFNFAFSPLALHSPLHPAATPCLLEASSSAKSIAQLQILETLIFSWYAINERQTCTAGRDMNLLLCGSQRCCVTGIFRGIVSWQHKSSLSKVQQKSTNSQMACR